MTKDDFGRFVGTVQTEWLDPDRIMRLLKDFEYVDPGGQRWLAKAGARIDGASIPRVLWTAIGSPFTGEYRAASVVHDVACEQKARPWQDVHRMFYFACRCGDVWEVKAKVMYGAVYYFGPRWGGIWDAAAPRGVAPQVDFEDLKRFVEARNPSLEEIDVFWQKSLSPYA